MFFFVFIERFGRIVDSQTNMPRQMFLAYFLLLFVCCQLCEEGCRAGSLPVQTNTNGNTISDFLKLEGKQIKYEFDSAGASKQGENKIAAKNIGQVFLVATKHFLVALAEVSDGDANNEQLYILANFLKTEGKNLANDAVKSGEWKAQVVTDKPTELKSENKVKSSAVVVNNDKIYYFFVTNSTAANGFFPQDANGDSKWHVAVIVGEKNSGSTPNEAIKWETLQPDKLTKVEELNEKLKYNPNKIPPAVGFVIEEKIVFAIQGEAKDQQSDGKNKYLTVFFQLDEQNINELYVEAAGNCYFALFLWKGQIVMIPSFCESESNPKMKVFDYKQKKFNESDRPFARLQEFLKNKNNFFTTKIVTKEIGTEMDVLLFTQESKKAAKNEVYLWVTDGNRTAKVDTIITGNEDNFDLSILHTKNELFALHKQKTGSDGALDDTKYDLRRLPELLTKINLILQAWKNTDDKIKDFFKETATETILFKDGLVGFLSDNGESDKYWKDEYFYENATVTSGTKTSEGFKFNGAGAGAKWLVKEKNKEDQPYNFADSGFTFVATVKIEKDANEKNSVLGVGLEGSEKKSIGLWCSKGMWAVGDKEGTAETISTTETCVHEEKYRVVLTMNDKEVSVYIDGKLIEKLPKTSIGVEQEALSVTHFYFGVNDAEQKPQSTNIESHVTVTNVLLYNRPFDVGEVKNLKECPKTPKITNNTDENKAATKQEGEVPPTPLQPDHNGEKADKKAPSPSRTEDGGVGGGMRVFSLLLALLCVSAPLLHL